MNHENNRDSSSVVEQDPLKVSVVGSTPTCPTKICSKCRNHLPLESFRLAHKPTGRRAAYCYECQRAVSRQHYADNTAHHKSKVIKNNKRNYAKNIEIYKEYKQTLKCNRCPEDHIAVLDFHHTDPKDKDYQVSAMLGTWKWASVLKEIEKCEVLCSNCHRKLHYELRNA